MSITWNRQTETARYTKLWIRKGPCDARHSAALWDARAEEWESELRGNNNYKGRSDQRVMSTAAYLRDQGLLLPGSEVVDIGCGPGRFASAFAGTAGHVTGIDISPRMAELGARFAAEQGVENASFAACDFKTVDIDEEKWRERFDLVFASITPALNEPASMYKMIAMSRAYCFNSTFVDSRDPVEEDALREVFHVEPRRRWDGSSFYAMFNLLWLEGYFPSVTYYKEHAEEYMSPGPLTGHIAERYLPDASGEDIHKIQAYLEKRADKDGRILCPSDRCYAWIHWDVRNRCAREY